MAKQIVKPGSGGMIVRTVGEEVTKVIIKELKGTTGRRIVRGIFGTIFKAR